MSSKTLSGAMVLMDGCLIVLILSGNGRLADLTLSKGRPELTGYDD